MNDVYLSANQQNDFQRDGFVAIDPLFDRETMVEINRELTRFITDVVPGMPRTQVYYENKNDTSTLKQIQGIFKHDGYFHNLMKSGVVRSIAEELLQDNVVPVNMQYFNKPAGVGQATPAHQDGYYFHLSPCEAVTGWLALEDVDEETGCINYVRGSHKSDSFRPHGNTNVIGFSQGITDFGTDNDKVNSVACPGSAGTFLMHHANTIHFASANTSATRSRRALGFIYYAERAKVDTRARDAYQKSLDTTLKSKAQI